MLEDSNLHSLPIVLSHHHTALYVCEGVIWGLTAGKFSFGKRKAWMKLGIKIKVGKYDKM